MTVDVATKTDGVLPVHGEDLAADVEEAVGGLPGRPIVGDAFGDVGPGAVGFLFGTEAGGC